jgi:dolichol-phosphate mannosyltransferase
MTFKPQSLTQYSPDVAIIIPSLNERDNVAPMLDALEAVLGGYRYEVIYVDDWSSDGTPDKVHEEAARRGNVRIIRRFGRRGLATAVIEGVLATHAPLVAVIDADMQHDERILPDLIAAVQSGAADMAIGSRYCDNGSLGEWEAGRVRSSKLATWLAHKLLRAPMSDPMSGYFVTTQAAVISALPRLSNMGFKVLLDIVASSKPALRIKELPYEFRTRQAGESKLDNMVAVEFLMMLLDKKFGKIISPRFFMFCAVGGLGLFVHLSVLHVGFLALSGGLARNALSEIQQHMLFLQANILAVCVAIAFNFWLNNSLTYHDKKLRGRKALIGLLSFYLVCAPGALANLGVGNFVFGRDKYYLFLHEYADLIAGLAGAVVGSIWNYIASSLLTWRGK